MLCKFMSLLLTVVSGVLPPESHYISKAPTRQSHMFPFMVRKGSDPHGSENVLVVACLVLLAMQDPGMKNTPR